MKLVRVGEINRQCDGTRVRTSSLIDGFDVWFESDDLPLNDSPEAFGSAFLIACLKKGLDLEIDHRVCPVWKTGIEKLSETLVQSGSAQTQKITVASVVANGEEACEPNRKTAQFFSGGVDSFYVLLKGGIAFDYLVFVHGYDIELADTVRFEQAHESMLAVASESGVKLCVVRTNLREHPLIKEVSWDDAHGGALAAVGHLLSSQIESITIPPSWPISMNQLWGSHWTLDPLWSSASLAVKHGDASLYRTDRLLSIAEEPLVQNNLRVCWENRTPAGNCSQCEKCLRTMLVLHQCRLLESYSTVFDLSVPIAKRIDALPYARVMKTFEEHLETNPEAELRSSLKRLGRRSSLKHALLKASRSIDPIKFKVKTLLQTVLR